MPIAPGLLIGDSVMVNEKYKEHIKSLIPPNKKSYQPIYWQHKGAGTGRPENLYQSIRINRSLESVKDRQGNLREFPEELFESEIEGGEIVKKSIENGLMIGLPISLFGKNNHTYPIADSEKLAQLNQRIDELTHSFNQGNQLPVRLANIVITWNLFQHFFPYFDIIDLDWEKELTYSLTATYQDKSSIDFRERLEKMTAKLHDGHIRVRMIGDDSESGTPRFSWALIGEELIITKILDTAFTQVGIGEVITHINNEKPLDYLEKIYARISSSTPGWKQYRGDMLSIQGEYMGTFEIKIRGLNGKERVETIKRDLRLKDFYLRNLDQKPTKELKDGIWYINLDQTPWAEIDSILPQLEKAKAIICDLRGYPKGNHKLISHLLSRKDTSEEWMQVPQIIYPDFQQVTWARFSWDLRPAKPHLDAPIYFLTDGRAISYAESYMSFIKHYDLATIIGQPTAGTNGNVNTLKLPGQYIIYYTGMRVRKHDRTELYGSGILPDVYLKRTKEEIIEGQDGFLEKALELIEKGGK